MGKYNYYTGLGLAVVVFALLVGAALCIWADTGQDAAQVACINQRGNWQEVKYQYSCNFGAQK